MQPQWNDKPYAAVFDMTLSIIKRCWSRETCLPGGQTEWTEENPSFGQSDVTSALLYSFLTEHLSVKNVRVMRGQVNHLTHWWIRLPDGTDVDMTGDLDRFPSTDGVVEIDAQAFIGDENRKARVTCLQDAMESIIHRAEDALKTLAQN